MVFLTLDDVASPSSTRSPQTLAQQRGAITWCWKPGLPCGLYWWWSGKDEKVRNISSTFLHGLLYITQWKSFSTSSQIHKGGSPGSLLSLCFYVCRWGHISYISFVVFGWVEWLWSKSFSDLLGCSFPCSLIKGFCWCPFCLYLSVRLVCSFLQLRSCDMWGKNQT